MGVFFTRKGGGGINISANSYFFSFFSLCSSLDFSSLFPSCCPLTDKPRGRRERCWRYVRLCVPRYRLCCCFQEPPLKSLLLPARITPATANGTSLPPCPTAWWYFPDQPSPGVTQLPFAHLPLSPGPRPLWSLHWAERFSCPECCQVLQEKEHLFCTLCFSPSKPSVWCESTSCSSRPLLLISSLPAWLSHDLA